MDVASVELRASIQDWDEGDVHAWLTTLGLPQYENQIRGMSPMCYSDPRPPTRHFLLAI